MNNKPLHLRSGEELGLWCHCADGKELPTLLPDGLKLFRLTEDLLRSAFLSLGFWESCTPTFVNAQAFLKSTHLPRFEDSVFQFKGSQGNTLLTPAKCPLHLQLFLARAKNLEYPNYRTFDLSGVYRYEINRHLRGFECARFFHQDDGHALVSWIDLQEEVKTFISKTLEIFRCLDFPVAFKLTEQRETSALDTKLWGRAQQTLINALEDLDIEYDQAPRGDSLFGPQLFSYVTLPTGRLLDLSCLQIDPFCPIRFDLHNKLGAFADTVVHLSVAGSIERLVATTLEHHQKQLPVCIAPTQIETFSLCEDNNLLDQVHQQLHARNIRFKHNTQASKVNLGKWVKKSTQAGIPLIVVIGQREASQEQISLRHRNEVQHINLQSLLNFVEERTVFDT